MANHGPYDRSLRAADSDREAIADILRDQHVAGRLDSDELQERIDRCYSAKTYADLDAIVADLPGEEPRISRARGPWLWPRFAFVPLLLIAIIALSHGHAFWLAIPLVFFLFVRRSLWRFPGSPNSFTTWRGQSGTGRGACAGHSRIAG